MTIESKYPIPRIDNLFDQLQGTLVFFKIDLRLGYHQLRVKHEDIPKMSFHFRYSQFEFWVMPFGLINSPTIFMNLMNRVFRLVLDQYIIIFINDILVYSKTPDEHVVHLTKVLETLQ